MGKCPSCGTNYYQASQGGCWKCGYKAGSPLPQPLPIVARLEEEAQLPEAPKPLEPGQYGYDEATRQFSLIPTSEIFGKEPLNIVHEVLKARRRLSN